jgi:hypothetical protein
MHPFKSTTTRNNCPEDVHRTAYPRHALQLPQSTQYLDYVREACDAPLGSEPLKWTMYCDAQAHRMGTFGLRKEQTLNWSRKERLYGSFHIIRQYVAGGI